MNDEIPPPIVDHWYVDLKRDRSFLVLAYDEDEESIDIQYFDGELDQLDLEEWEELSLEKIEQPEDWSGPMDELEKDDLGYEEL